MQSLNIAQSGYGYIFRCIGLYYEGNIYFVLYIVSLIFLSIKDKGGSKRMRELFLPQFIMMALTVYNPVFPVALNSFFDVNKEYYRFLWMAPVILCIATAATIIITEHSDREADGGSLMRKVICTAFILLMLIAGGKWLYADGYIVSPNMYHVPTEIPEVAQIIHEDALARDPEDKYPRAMMEYDYNMIIRQYDASILLACDREAYIDAVSGVLDYETALKDENYCNRLLAVVALGMRLPYDEFKKGLDETGTGYIVISKNNEMRQYLEDFGMRVAGETQNHLVLQYTPEDYEPFILADYHDLWYYNPEPYDFLM
jgi:hypothetical protein